MVFMDIYGCLWALWIFMDLSAYSCICIYLDMDILICTGIYLEIFGYIWKCMGVYGHLWTCTEGSGNGL